MSVFVVFLPFVLSNAFFFFLLWQVLFVYIQVSDNFVICLFLWSWIEMRRTLIPCNGGFIANFHRQEPCIPWTNASKLWLNWGLGLGGVGRTGQIYDPDNRHPRHCFNWMKSVFLSGFLLYFSMRPLCWYWKLLSFGWKVCKDSRTDLSPILVSSSQAINLVTLFFILCSWLSVPADASNPDSVVVSVLNISATLGSQAVLPCKSYRMVWTQDRLNDRQRVVHWDVYSKYYGDNKMERLCDMYSAGDQRVYSSYNQGRIFMPQNAFTDGNFSLVIKGTEQDLFSLCYLQNGGCMTNFVFFSENGYFTEYFL